MFNYVGTNPPTVSTQKELQPSPKQNSRLIHQWLQPQLHRQKLQAGFKVLMHDCKLETKSSIGVTRGGY